MVLDIVAYFFLATLYTGPRRHGSWILRRDMLINLPNISNALESSPLRTKAT